MTNDDVAKDGIAFAITYADNCQIPEGFANDKNYDNQDWMSDWAAYLTEAVWDELHARGFKIIRTQEAKVGTTIIPDDGTEIYRGPQEPNGITLPGGDREARKRTMKLMSPPARS